MGPLFQVWRSEDTNYEVLSIRDHHNPIITIPDDLRISELARICTEYWITGIFGESVASIMRIGDLLDLLSGSIERVNGYDAVRLVGKEPRGVIDVDYSASTKDLAIFCGENCYFLILPAV